MEKMKIIEKMEKMKIIEKFRYNHTVKSRKDTMYTIREGNLLFYGIARCNLRVGDKFDRDLGKQIAVGRALEARRLFEEDRPIMFDDDDVKANRMGVTTMEQLRSLLDYFDSLADNHR